MADYQTANAGVGIRSAEIDQGLRAHMNKVYGTMSVGMFITFLAAWAISGLAVTSDPAGASVMIRDGQYLTGLGEALYLSPLKWVVMFAPLAFLWFGMGAAMNRLSSGGAQLAFYAFAVMMGVSISSIFLVFTGYSIIQVFLITAISFAGLSIVGYTTKRDISGMGAFLIMGVIGLLVAMIFNIFIGSETLAMVISILGVLIFAGLTAYDTQNIKNTYLAHAHHGDQEWLAKAGIMGALNLYLDFINMFMFLLQLLGNRE